jgi:adenylate cyclase
VVRYSRLLAEDEQGTIQTLTDYREAIRTLVEQHHGRVVDAPGDNLLAEFPNVLGAVQCAVETQGVLKVRNQSLTEQRRMLFRIGVHLGDVTVEGGRIYGDGVNIAARLEGLAEAGGICISAIVHEQVERKLGLDFEDLGEQSVKNIPKPVRAYQVRLDTAVATAKAPSRAGPRAVLVAGVVVLLVVAGLLVWRLPTTTPSIAPSDEQFMVPGFGDAPAIAVLAFDNLSGDPEQEYFADGIAEDLITRLSSSRRFPVIARNSTFTYKGSAVDVQQVGREVGARYVVEGSVRKSGDRVRISAQLIDAATGTHVWADTYDRELGDMFAVQDELTQAIVGSLYPAFLQAERTRAVRKEPRNLDAYDLRMRGLWHFFKLTKEENAKARSLFERAIELDPQSSGAFVGLAMTHWNDAVFQWTDTPAKADSELMRAAREAVELDSNSSGAHQVLSLAYLSAGKPDEMIAAGERAVELNPSHAAGHTWQAFFLSEQGRLEEALASAERAIRLSPRDPMRWFFFSNLAGVHFNARRYEDAVEWARRSIRGNPSFPFSRAILAASYGNLGRLTDARKEVEGLLRVQPGFSLSFAREGSVADPAYLDHYLGGLRKGGLPE